ncbi:MAG: transglutaminase-like domain-containing protein [Candidatus Bathyarchaeia archaeon]|nr:transglutaminase domain-containing protein [Candidatus Bathyarchaeota archaeon]
MRKKKATLDDILKILNEIVKINLETLNYSKLILKQLSNNDESDKNSNGNRSVMPIVDFRFGEQYYVNDFLQLNNPTLKAIVSKITFNSNDEKVKAITEYIKKNYTYPFMMDGTPSCGGYFLRFQKDNRFKGWYWKAIRDYMWSFPVECAIQGYGICIDTSNLAFSLLRMLGVQAKVCLGAVYETKSGQLLGYHAWVEVPYKNETYVFETTIHPDGENLLPARVVYGKKMDVYYVKEAEYDEEEYREIQS